MNKDLEKDFKDVTPDGHVEIVEGKEPLKKKPKKEMEKSAYERWQELKKHLDNEIAFMDLAAAEGDDDSSADSNAVPDQSADDSGDSTSAGDSGAEEDSEGQQISEESTGQEESEEGSQESEEGSSEQEDESEELSQEEITERLIEALREEGHSDAEIHYIVHGHIVAPPDHSVAAMHQSKLDAESARQQQADMHSIDADHKKRMADLEYETAKQATPDHSIDKEHRKRMLDLEYEAAKARVSPPDTSHHTDHEKKMLELEYQRALKEMQLELEFKEKELQLKLKQIEEAAKAKAEKKAQDNAKKESDSAQEKALEKASTASDLSEEEGDEDNSDENGDEREMQKEELPYWHPKAQIANQKRVREMEIAERRKKAGILPKPTTPAAPTAPTKSIVPGTYNMPTARGVGKKYIDIE